MTAHGGHRDPGLPPERDRDPGLPPERDRDPGLQPERTALAWSRTGIVMAVVAVSTAGLALRRPSTAGSVAATLATLCTAAVAVLILQTATAVSRHDLVDERSPWSRLVTLATACALLAAAGTVLALAPPQ